MRPKNILSYDGVSVSVSCGKQSAQPDDGQAGREGKRIVGGGEALTVRAAKLTTKEINHEADRISTQRHLFPSLLLSESDEPTWSMPREDYSNN